MKKFTLLDLFKYIVDEEKVLSYLNTKYPLYKDYKYEIYSHLDEDKPRMKIIISSKFNDVMFFIYNWHVNLFADYPQYEELKKDFYSNKLEEHVCELKPEVLSYIDENVQIPIKAYNRFIISSYFLNINVPSELSSQFLFTFDDEYICVDTDNSYRLQNLINMYCEKFKMRYVDMISERIKIIYRYKFANPDLAAGLIMLKGENIWK